jgi:uncharacterized protein YdeI (YjbR/CyaY-like superfamily)
VATTAPKARSFATREALGAWLAKHHAASTELWVRIFKKSTKRPSVTWDDCVVAAIAWGWIDGQKRSLDEDSFLQRLTPRRPRSNWSKRNREHAERLIAEGVMQPPGLAHVDAARADGRWARAYAGSADMVFPDEFLRALKKVPKARAFFATLKRAELYSIYHRLHTAKRADTRARRIELTVAALAQGKVPGR